MQLVRVLIADDQPHVVAHMQEQLSAQSWIKLLGLAPSFAAAAEWLVREPVDVVIFGLVGMGESPFTGVRRMRSAAPQTRLVVCSSKIHEAETLLREGVLGYLTRTEDPEALLDAIRSVMRGERYCSPKVAEFLEQTTGPLRITPEERRVLELLSEGVLDTLALSERLDVHPVVVQKHLNALRNKTHCFRPEELASWYQRYGTRLTPEGTLRPDTNVET
jgi:DNA-binding NarL/FixJ family response regulator